MEKKYAYWLCNLPGIGDRSIRKLLEACGGTPQKVYYAGEKRWREVLRARQAENMMESTINWDLEGKYAELKQKGIGFCTQEENGYPERLKQIPDPPYGLYYRGRLPLEEQMSVAIIGARDCSQYGSYVAAQLGRFLGEKGIQIISGMAKGIDGISQAAALETGGTSFGVLGCGVDICYPAQNRRLYEDLQRRGGVISSFPPGTLAKSGNFPPRNRIVSGLADAVVVIEARQKSGTLITVDMALEQGKEVYVVPGRITDQLSDGCNNLLKQGAGVLVSFSEFLGELQQICRKQQRVGMVCEEQDMGRKEIGGEKSEGITAAVKALPEEIRRVYNVLDFYPQSLTQITEKLPENYGYIRVSTVCQKLCMEQLALQLSPGFFCRKE